MLVAALGLAGCNESTTLDQVASGARANGQLPQSILSAMKAKGMSRESPVMARIFKEEGKVEIWKEKKTGRYDLIATYDICKWSGQLGPKYIEGDRQAPEGFYTVRPSQMNPQSNYYLAFNMGYPNAYDRAHGRTGSNLMVHGACSSSGCYSMTDAQIEQIYAFGRDAFRGGQTEFQIQAFPFRMTAANMARYRKDPNYEFWTNLKEGYDQFEITKVPPKVDVCEKRYVFNRVPEGSATFNPTAACPPSTQPETLTTAYQSYQSSYDKAFASAAKSSGLPPKPSINGLKEANLVAGWTKQRSRGERVPIEPPALNEDGTVVVTARMGRIDSPAGRRQAALDAAAAEKARAAEEKKAIALAQEEAKKAAAIAAAQPAEPVTTGTVATAAEAPAAQATAIASEPVSADPEATQPPAESTGLLGGARKRIMNIFGS